MFVKQENIAQIEEIFKELQNFQDLKLTKK